MSNMQRSPNLLDLPDQTLLRVYEYLQAAAYRHPVYGRSNYDDVADRGFALSSTCQRLRELALESLFDTYYMGQNWSERRIIRACDTLKKASISLRRCVHHLWVGIWPEDPDDLDDEDEQINNPSLLPTSILRDPASLNKLLAQSILDATQALPNLTRLTFATAAMPSTDLFAAFTTLSSSLTSSTNPSPLFPQLANVNLSPDTHWLISFCSSNLQSIDTTDWSYTSAQLDSLLAAAATHVRTSDLHHFGIYATWTASLLRRVHAALPNIRSLRLGGDVDHRIRSILKAGEGVGADDPHSLNPIVGLARGLSVFEKLECVTVPEGERLLGQGWSWREKYEGRICESWNGKNIMCDLIPQEEVVVRACFDGMPALRELRLGRVLKARLEMGSQRQMMVSWEKELPKLLAEEERQHQHDEHRLGTGTIVLRKGGSVLGRLLDVEHKEAASPGFLKGIAEKLSSKR